MIYSLNESSNTASKIDFGVSTIGEASLVAINMIDEAFNDLKFAIVLGENNTLLKYGNDLNAIREAEENSNKKGNILEAIKNIFNKFGEIVRDLIDRAVEGLNKLAGTISGCIRNVFNNARKAAVTGKFTEAEQKDVAKAVEEYISSIGEKEYIDKYVKPLFNDNDKKPSYFSLQDFLKPDTTFSEIFITDPFSGFDDIKEFTSGDTDIKKEHVCAFIKGEVGRDNISKNYSSKNVIDSVLTNNSPYINISALKKRIDVVIKDNLNEAKKASNDNEDKLKELIDKCKRACKYNTIAVSVINDECHNYIRDCGNILKSVSKDAAKGSGKKDEKNATNESFNMLLGSISSGI